MPKIHPVILCGGSGTRLWPSSRKAFPKQFSQLVGQESLFQSTLKRLTGDLFEQPVILTNSDFRFIVHQQAEAIGNTDCQIILEPAARDTAPAILTAALLKNDCPDDLLLVAPSDHLIENQGAFLDGIKVGSKAAKDGHLITFGISPTGPETGYGYLELPGPIENGNAVKLQRFVEKPDHETAGQMLESQRYLWNAGIFLFRVCDILDAFELFEPDMVQHCQLALEKAGQDLGFTRLDPVEFEKSPSLSIDYAIMEKAKKVSVVPIDPGWSDLGSWSSLHNALSPTDAGVLTTGGVTAIDCEHSVLRNEDDNVQLVGLGLSDIVAVATRDAVLVADIGRSQDVKAVVDRLRQDKIAQADDYPQFHRPWGWYETLCISDNFQVKRIMVRPGGVLSLQSHKQRAEHWVVVKGTAKVTIGADVKTLKPNQSAYIPLGCRHRLENPGDTPMYLIEVQTGTYLGEDDITRYEDVYDRQ